MKNSKAKRGLSRVMQSTPVMILLGLFILLFAWNVAGFIGKMQETTKKKNIAEENLAELQEAKVKLSSDIESLGTPRGVEENIRDKFGFAKEGEKLIVIVDEKKSAEPEEEKKENGFFSFLKNLFK